MRARDFSGIPMPVSETRTTTSLSSDSAVTSTRPPPGVYFTAFSTRLENMEVSCVSSPPTVYVAALPERFQEREMFLRRAVGRWRASTTIRMLLRSTGWGFWIPSSLSRRVISNRSVISLASLSVSSRSCSAKKRAPSGSSPNTSTRLSASSFRLVAGVFSSWETFATKSRRILLTLCSSSGLTGRVAFGLSNVCSPRSRPGGPWPRFEAVAEAPGGVDVLVGRLLFQGGPYPAYVHVYGARGAHARVPPDLFRQLLAAPQLPGGRGQGGQQFELLQAQLQRFPPRVGGKFLRVHSEVARLYHLAPG